MIGAFVLVAAIGVLIGLLSGLLGVGGGVVMVPLLRLAFGLSPLASTATSLFTVIPTSAAGVLGHLRGKTCWPALGAALGIGGACTSSLGVWLAQLSPGWLVMVAAGLVIAYSGFTMLRKALQQTPPATPVALGEVPQEAAVSPQFQAPKLGAAGTAKAVGIGMLAGVASGYVGLGGGFLMVPLLVAVMKLPMRIVSGTSLIAVLILATPATITQCMLGNVNFLYGIALACGTIPGALMGARLIQRVPERSLRIAFAVFLGVAAILLVVNELGGMA